MLLTVDEVATMFKVHKRTIYRWIEEVGLPCIKIGNTLRFDEDEIKEWWKHRRGERNVSG